VGIVLTYDQFAKIYADLPHDVALYYSDVRRRFNLSHERAYKHTLAFASSIGKAVGSAGLPAHESACKRLLLRNET
jgi:hypothetical protein